MTEILCNWLNNEAKLSKNIETTHFGADFSSGYLFGELLHLYGLQDDFDQFTPTTLEPTVHLLDIPFDTKVAREIMDAKPGAAAKLVYELFVALSRKEKAGLTGTAIETMRAKAPAKLHALAAQVYRDGMHRKIPRESTLQLERISQTYSERQKKYEAFAFRERLEEDERRRNAVAMAQEKASQERKKRQTLQAELLARLRAAKYDVSDFVPTKTHLTVREGTQTKIKELRSAMTQIDAFEKRLEETRPVVAMSDAELVEYIKRNQKLQDMRGGEDELELPEMDLQAVMQGQKDAADNVNEYMTRIKRRLAEERAARVEREKRRRKVLLDQLRAREQQEEERREQLLLNRLLRRSQQERRIAAQLIAVRREKDNIRENRMLVQKKFAEAREAEFRAALEQQAEMCRLKAEEDAVMVAEAKRTHETLMEERKQVKYEKHYAICWETFEAIIDLSCRYAEYRQMTNKKPVPLGLSNEWKRLMIAGLPIYESDSLLSDLPPDDVKPVSDIVPPQLLSLNALALLDQLDFSDYLTSEGVWKDAESESTAVVQKETHMPDEIADHEQSLNRVLKHVTGKVVNAAFPPPPKPKTAPLPQFRLITAVVGKPLSGTSTVCNELAKDSRVKLLNMSDLVSQALKLSQEAFEVDTAIREPTEQSLAETTVEANTQSEELQPSGSASEINQAQEAKDETQESNQEQQKQTDTASAQQQPPPPPSQSEAVASATEPPAESQSVAETAQDATIIPAEEAAPQLDEEAVFLQKRIDLAVEIANHVVSGQSVPVEMLAQLVIDELRSVPAEESQSTIVVICGFPVTLNEIRVFHALSCGFEISGDGNIDLGFGKAKQSSKFLDLLVGLECPDQVCLARNGGHSDAGADTNPNFHGLEQHLVWFAERWPEVEKYCSKAGVTCKKIDACMSIDSVASATADAIGTRIAELEAPPPEPEPIPEPPPPTPPLLETVVAEAEPPPPPPAPTPPPAPSGKKDKKSGKSTGKKREPSPKGGKKGGKKTPEPEPLPPAPVAPPEPPGPTPDMDEWIFVDRAISDEITLVLAEMWRSAVSTYNNDLKRALRGIRLEGDQLVRFLYRVRVDLATMLQQPDTKRDFVTVFCRDFNYAVSGEIRTVDDETRAELHQRCDDLRDRLWTICENKRAVADKRRLDISTSGWLEERIGIVLNHLIRMMQAEIDRFHAGVCMLRDYYKAMDSPIPEGFIHPTVKLGLYQLPSEESLLADLATAETGSPNPADNQTSIPPSVQSSAIPPRPDSRSRSKKSRSPKPSASGDADLVSSAVPATQAQSVAGANLEFLPRRPRDLQPTVAVLPDAAAVEKKRKTSAGKQRADKKGKGKDTSSSLIEARRVEPSTQLPSDLELRLLHDSWWNAFTVVHNLSTVEQMLSEKEREAAEEARNAMLAERAAAAGAAAAEKEKEKEKDKKKGKGKARSPSPQKGRSPSPKAADIESGETAAEKEKRLTKDKMRQEFIYAIEADEKSVKSRLEMIRARGHAMLEEMKRASAVSLDSMSEMAGQRFLFEMTAVDQLLAFIRNSIEHSAKLDANLILDGDRFWALFGDERTQAARGSLVPTSPIIEMVTSTLTATDVQPTTEPTHQFSISQLYALHQQFVRFAPSGVMETRAFEELVRDVGSDLFSTTTTSPLGGPAGTKRQVLSPAAVSELAQLVAIDGDFADWRLLLLCLAHPWPVPTRSDLVTMLVRFRDMDQRRLSTLSRPQYNRVEMWFNGSPVEQAFGAKDLNSTQRPPSAGDVVWRGGVGVEASDSTMTSTPQLDVRLQQFRDFLFDIFSEMPQGIDLPAHLQQPRIDYVTMLSYVLRVPDSAESLLRMLTLATADYIICEKLSNKTKVLAKQKQEACKMLDHLRHAADMSRDHLRIPIEPLFRVLSTHIRMRASHSRVGDAAAKEERVLKEKLQNVYAELSHVRGFDECVPLSVILKHPVLEDIMIAAASNFRAPPYKAVFRVFQENEKEPGSNPIQN